MAEKVKLTIRVDRRWVEAAKAYARQHDTSLSRLISGYLRELATERPGSEDPPILRRLTGILPADVSVDKHR